MLNERERGDYRMPGGDRTQDKELFKDEMRRVAYGCAEALGAELLEFDPDVRVQMPGRGDDVEIDMDVAAAIVRMSERLGGKHE